MSRYLPEIEKLARNAPIRTYFHNSFALQDHEKLLLAEEVYEELMKQKENEKLTKLVKQLLALVPYSTFLIDKILSKKGKDNREIQFIIMCYLDDVIAETLFAESDKHHLMEIVKHFLLERLDDDVAFVAWMSIDLLSVHITSEISYPILINLVKDAKYAVVRENAIQGLKKIVKENVKLKGEVKMALRRVLKEDRSLKVQNAAKYYLKKLREL